jgi:Fe-S-cluster containining protein
MRNDLYIPFFEDLIDFDCVECGMRCCESGLIAATKKEAEILVREYPFMNFFLNKKEYRRLNFEKYPRCWFLEKNGLCEIQRKYGYSLKPFICRLHPFYVAKCGESYIVTPSGCDRLRAARKGRESSVSQAALLNNAEEAISCGFVREELEWSREKLDLEKIILRKSMEYLEASNYADFAAVQVSLAQKQNDLSEIRSRIRDAVELWTKFLGIEGLKLENATINFELTALTSILRATSGPLLKMEESRIPLALTALFVYMNLFSRSDGAERYLATYKLLLGDIPVALTYLTREDLRHKHLPLDKKLFYVRALRQVYTKQFDRKPIKAMPSRR